MNFPISRDEMLNYRNNITFKNQIDVRVNSIIKEINSGVELTITTTNLHKYVYGAERHLIFDGIRDSYRVITLSQPLVIDKVLAHLKDQYKDCKVYLDPLQKTITVDWSKQTPADWFG
jgi:hypothetical protein